MKWVIFIAVYLATVIILREVVRQRSPEKRAEEFL